MAKNLWMRAKGLLKTGICAAACAASITFYIPFILPPAGIIAIGGIITAAIGVPQFGLTCLAVAATLAASPALLGAESLSGVKQLVTGKRSSAIGAVMEYMSPTQKTLDNHQPSQLLNISSKNHTQQKEISIPEHTIPHMRNNLNTHSVSNSNSIPNARPKPKSKVLSF